MAAPRVMYLLHRSRLFLMTANSSLADLSTRVPAHSRQHCQLLDETPPLALLHEAIRHAAQQRSAPAQSAGSMVDAHRDGIGRAGDDNQPVNEQLLGVMGCYGKTVPEAASAGCQVSSTIRASSVANSSRSWAST